jgi:hypothetical protein
VSTSSPDPRSRSPRDVVLLGAQRFDSTLGSVVRGLECEGPFAIITAGWREREAEDEALRAHLECETVNLELYGRAAKVFASDRELAAAHRRKQTTLRHKQDFYRIRLEHELAANHVIRLRRAPAEVLEQEEAASVAAIRMLDSYHLDQCSRTHAEFEAELRPSERPSVAEHREQLAEILARCKAVAIAGGHVASLLNRMRLFGLRELLLEGGHAIFAWSGGGMVVSEQGPGASEILGEGLGLVPNIVMLPHPETRLRLDDPERVGLLARRFAPAACLAFPEGAHLRTRDGQIAASSGVIRLRGEGDCAPLEEHPA